MDCEIAWTDRASADLRQVYDYISEHNPNAAANVVDTIVERVEVLKATPRMGRLYTNRDGQEIRQLVSGKYRIFCTVVAEQDRVEILTIWNGARQEPDLSV